MKRHYISTVLTLVFAGMAVSAQQPDSELMRLLPDIPKQITAPEQRAQYLTAHFFDKLNFRDTSILFKDNLLERYFVEYADVLSVASPEAGAAASVAMMKKAEAEPVVFKRLTEFGIRYLYDAASPVSDEEKLIPILQYALKSPLLDEYGKLRPKYILDCILKNRIGEKANDLSYTLINGNKGSLYTIEADYVLLFFKDPECEDCRETAVKLAKSQIISDFVQKGKLKILTVCTSEYTEVWKKHASEVPSNWLYAIDGEQKINNEQIYDVKHFPLLYLIDGAGKTVLLKDTEPEIIENYLNIF